MDISKKLGLEERIKDIKKTADGAKENQEKQLKLLQEQNELLSEASGVFMIMGDNLNSLTLAVVELKDEVRKIRERI
jgi:hypothetical protein